MPTSKKRANAKQYDSSKSKKPLAGAQHELKEMDAEATAMVVRATKVSGLLKDPRFNEKFKDDKVVSEAAMALLNNLNSLNTRLNALRQKHSEMNLTDEIEGTLNAIVIGEDYENWMYNYNETVLPSLVTLSEFAEQVAELETPTNTYTASSIMEARQPVAVEELPRQAVSTAIKRGQNGRRRKR